MTATCPSINPSVHWVRVGGLVVVVGRGCSCSVAAYLVLAWRTQRPRLLLHFFCRHTCSASEVKGQAVVMPKQLANGGREMGERKKIHAHKKSTTSSLSEVNPRTHTRVLLEPG